MYPLNIDQVHIELTDKCQAACPMCMRNYFGGKEREIIKNVEVSLDDIKKWFPLEFLKTLRYFYACGSLGDPIIAKDCLEIFQYLKDAAPNCQFSIHTNGSMRSSSWWKQLATVLADRGSVTFAIDGFKGEHELYRRNTSWDKIIENAKVFIAAGGQATADCLIFEHNESRILELKEFLLSLGFKEVNLKTTNRFYGDGTFPVQDKLGNLEYVIKPPTNSKWASSIVNPKINDLAKEVNFFKMMNAAQIDPLCVKKKEIYIDARGTVYPCCWTGSIVAPPVDTVSPELTIIRDRLSKDTNLLMNDLGLFNLHEINNVLELLKLAEWDHKLEKHWTVDKKFVCVKQCASNWKTIVEQ